AEVAADAFPVLLRWRAARGERGEGGADILDGEAELLGDQHEGEAADIGAEIAALSACIAGGRDEAFRFVEADGGDCEAGAFRKVTDAERRVGGEIIRHLKIIP